MKRGNFRRHRASFVKLAKKYLIPVKTNKQVRKVVGKIHRHGYPLTETDQINYEYSYIDRKTKGKKKRKILEITCVSYEILIGEDWKTIVYYDDSHDGLMHKHVMISIDDKKGEVSDENIKQKGGRKQLMGWAIKELTKNSDNYKRHFLKRNKKLLTS